MPEESRITKLIHGLIIGIACYFTYQSIIGIGFLSDDWLIISKIQHGAMMDIGSAGVFFRPMTILSFALDDRLFGMNAAGFHLHQIFHLFLTALGVAACARVIINRPYAGLAAGIIFAVMPVHSEAVSWISGRYDLMCGMFIVWSFYLYLLSCKYRENPWYRLGSIPLYALALMSKEMAFAFPLVILLHALWPVVKNEDVSRETRLRDAVPYFLIAVGWFILRWWRLGGIGAEGYMPGEGGFDMLGYVGKIFLSPLIAMAMPYIPKTPAGFHEPLYPAAYTLLFYIPLAGLLFKPPWKVLGFCYAAIALSILPVAHLGIITGTLESTRFFYTPSIFLAIFIASLLIDNRLLGKDKFLSGFFTIVFVIFLCVNTLYLSSTWGYAEYLTQKVRIDTNPLVRNHDSGWGTKYKKIVFTDALDNYHGAYIFRWGFPEMIHLKHPGVLDNVEIYFYRVNSDGSREFNPETYVQPPDTVVWTKDEGYGLVEILPGEGVKIPPHPAVFGG